MFLNECYECPVPFREIYFSSNHYRHHAGMVAGRDVIIRVAHGRSSCVQARSRDRSKAVVSFQCRRQERPRLQKPAHGLDVGNRPECRFQTTLPWLNSVTQEENGCNGNPPSIFPARPLLKAPGTSQTVEMPLLESFQALRAQPANCSKSLLGGAPFQNRTMNAERHGSLEPVATMDSSDFNPVIRPSSSVTSTRRAQWVPVAESHLLCRLPRF